MNDLGAMYGRGDGFPNDNTLAYMWYNLSAQNGNKRANNNKTLVIERMSNSDIIRGDKISELCSANKYRDCLKYSNDINEKPSLGLRTLPDETNQTLFGYKLGTKVADYFTQNEVKSHTFDFEEAAAK